MRYVPEVVASYPAYDIIKPRVCQFTNLPVFKSHDVVALKKPRFYKMFTFGSVASFALENGDDPLESYEESKAKGHALYWLNANCVAITAHDEPKETYYEVNYGDEVLFEGKIFTVEKDFNDNLKLVDTGKRKSTIINEIFKAS